MAFMISARTRMEEGGVKGRLMGIANRDPLGVVPRVAL